jgi:hypothetical protein
MMLFFSSAAARLFLLSGAKSQMILHHLHMDNEQIVENAMVEKLRRDKDRAKSERHAENNSDAPKKLELFFQNTYAIVEIAAVEIRHLVALCSLLRTTGIALV